jgi:hypothetical protein
MVHGVEVWGLGGGEQNDNIQGSFVFMKELRIFRCAANKSMNSNSKEKVEKQR